MALKNRTAPIFALKEIVNYYKSLSTPVFLCFLDIKSAFDKISYKKLFCVLAQRGAPKYLILLLLNWYLHQRLFVLWGGTVSESFGMQNGIRQGSCLSPYIFNVYVDDLNKQLNNSGVGCHIAGVSVNNLSYADDFLLLGPDAKSLNQLLDICYQFANENYITFSTSKTEAMVMLPAGMRIPNPPQLTLGGSVINYCDKFKYLGHIITKDGTDDEDIARETRNLYIRGNMIVRKFGFLSVDVKCSLFKSYCYPLYTCSLWSKYRQATINKLKVCYNNTMRKLLGVPPWHSARTMFVSHNVRSFPETVRCIAYSLMTRVVSSANYLIGSLIYSDCFTVSSQRIKWISLLYSNPDITRHFQAPA